MRTVFAAATLLVIFLAAPALAEVRILASPGAGQFTIDNTGIIVNALYCVDTTPCDAAHGGIAVNNLSHSTPEPASIAVFGVAMAGLAKLRRRARS